MTKLFSVLLFASFMVKAQSDIPKTSLYFLVGPSYLSTRGLTQFDPSVILHHETRFGYSVGLGLVNSFSKHFGLSTRFLWERKRYQVNEDFYSLYNSSGLLSPIYQGTNSYDVTNDYLTISMVPQFLFAKRFNLGIGAYFGVLVKSSTYGQYFYPSHAYLFNSYGEYNKTDYGLSFNMGYTFPFKHLKFTVQLTDSYGLKNVPSRSNLVVQPPQQQQSQNPWYNNTYSILLGISYDKINRKINNVNLSKQLKSL